jgi:aerobic carbon-monoxide dehydrogenase medium subunit
MTMFIRRLPKFEYHAPTSLAEALGYLSQYNANAKVFAGGTDLFVSMKRREMMPEHLINLKGIEELKHISYDAENGLRIGGLVTLGELERSEIIKDKFCTLNDVFEVMASPQIRNLGTMGGNLCSALPSADTAPPLIAMGASVKLTGSKGERTVLVEEFFKGPGESVLEHDEILTEILIPSPPENSGGSYLKLMRRNALDLAIVNVAAFLIMDGNKRVCNNACIALGTAATTPIRASKAEKVIMKKAINEDLAAGAGKAAAQEARPRSSIRASESYRREMIGALTERAIMEAYKRIADDS